MSLSVRDIIELKPQSPRLELGVPEYAEQLSLTLVSPEHDHILLTPKVRLEAAMDEAKRSQDTAVSQLDNAEGMLQHALDKLEAMVNASPDIDLDRPMGDLVSKLSEIAALKAMAASGSPVAAAMIGAQIAEMVASASTVASGATNLAAGEKSVFVAEMTVEAIGTLNFDQILSAGPADFAAMSVEQLDAYDNRLMKHVSEQSDSNLDKLEDMADQLAAQGQHEEAERLRQRREELIRELRAAQGDGLRITEMNLEIAKETGDPEEIRKAEEAFVKKQLVDAARQGVAKEELVALEHDNIQIAERTVAEIRSLALSEGKSSAAANELADGALYSFANVRDEANVQRELSTTDLIAFDVYAEVILDENQARSALFGTGASWKGSVDLNAELSGQIAPKTLEEQTKEVSKLLAESGVGDPQEVDERTKEPSSTVAYALPKRGKEQTVV
jgi:hypothetical protein